jgi:hypothetical protein
MFLQREMMEPLKVEGLSWTEKSQRGVNVKRKVLPTEVMFIV